MDVNEELKFWENSHKKFQGGGGKGGGSGGEVGLVGGGGQGGCEPNVWGRG